MILVEEDEADPFEALFFVTGFDDSGAITDDQEAIAESEKKLNEQSKEEKALRR